MDNKYQKLIKENIPPPKPEESLIIHHPEAMSPWRKRAEWTLTTAGWLVWFFLVRPLLISLLWLFGFRLFVEHMITLGGIRSLGDLSLIYVAVIMLLYVIVRGWNFYNASTFRGKERRLKKKEVAPEESEEFFRLPPGAINKIQKWGSVTVDFIKKNELQVSRGIGEGKKEGMKGYFRPS